MADFIPRFSKFFKLFGKRLEPLNLSCRTSLKFRHDLSYLALRTHVEIHQPATELLKSARELLEPFGILTHGEDSLFNFRKQLSVKGCFNTASAFQFRVSVGGI